MRNLLIMLSLAFAGGHTESRTIGSSLNDAMVQDSHATMVHDRGLPQGDGHDSICEAKEETLIQTEQREVDVLLVIDPSASMMEEMPRLLATAARYKKVRRPLSQARR